MRFILIYLSSILSVGVIHAQTDDSLKLASLEQMTLAYKSRSQFYASSALKTWQNNFPYSNISLTYFNSDADVYLPQGGSGSEGFRIASNSFKNLPIGLTLWGNAFYTNEKIKNQFYNESLDYSIIYPYVMFDTIGGDLKSETYHFNGGASKNFKRLNLGFNGAYTGGLGYRKTDPRPENTSSKIDLSIAISKKLFKDYRAALDIKGSKYHQRNTLDFVSDLGAPAIYHDAGLGAYNDLLDGSNAVALLNGSNKGFSIGFAPESRTGLMFTSGFDQLSIKKRLSDVTAEIGKVTDNAAHGAFGYLWQKGNSAYMIKVTAKFKTRESLEANFNNRGDATGFVKISETRRFTHEETTAGVELNGEKRIGVKQLSGQLQSHLAYDNFQYINPNRNLHAVNWQNRLQANYIFHVGRNLILTSAWLSYRYNLQSSSSWPDVTTQHSFYNLLNNMYRYYSSNRVGLGGLARIDIPASYQINCFGQIQATYTRFDPVGGTGSNISFSIGVGF